MVRSLNASVAPAAVAMTYRGAARSRAAAGDAMCRGCAAELAGVQVADGALDQERLRGAQNGPPEAGSAPSVRLC
jgi:hypothetical protein